VLGITSDDPFPYNIGVAGLAVINSTSIPDDQMDAAMAAVAQIGRTLLDAHAAGETGDEDPLFMPSSLVH
jgi:hypothetical protein